MSEVTRETHAHKRFGLSNSQLIVLMHEFPPITYLRNFNLFIHYLIERNAKYRGRGCNEY